MNTVSSLVEQAKMEAKKGKVASYIPELGHVDPNLFGISAMTIDGAEHHFGDYQYTFTMQSISKIVILLCALLDQPFEAITEKVSFEPNSESFNSIVSLETRNYNKPLNPMINAGAIVTTSLIKGTSPDEKISKILQWTRTLCNNPSLEIDESVFLSEKSTGFRNYSLAYFLKSTGVIDDNVDDLLEVYFKACSISVACSDLATLALVLANDGKTVDGKTLFSKEIARIIRSTIALCGLYDQSGEFALQVGLPSKSGVSGAILSVAPHKMGIAVFSPALNEKGNSIGGIHLLRAISSHFDLYIY